MPPPPSRELFYNPSLLSAGNRVRLLNGGAQAFPRMLETIGAFIIHGVFQRHPMLRVASIENGSDWLHVLVKRLRKQANQTPWVFPEDPLDTLRRHVWVTPYLEEDLGALAGDVGFLPTAAFCGRLRGDWLNLSAAICGSRFGRAAAVSNFSAPLPVAPRASLGPVAHPGQMEFRLAILSVSGGFPAVRYFPELSRAHRLHEPVMVVLTCHTPRRWG